MIKFNNIINEKIRVRDMQHTYTNDYLHAADHFIASNDQSLLLTLIKNFPGLHKEITQHIKKEYGNTVTLYRGMAFEDEEWQENIGSATMHEEKVLKSYSGRTVFSWTSNYKIAQVFASASNQYTLREVMDGYGIIFEAEIPAEQILFAMPLFDIMDIKNVEDRRGYDFHGLKSYYDQDEFTVWHNKPVTATVVEFERHDYSDA